MKKTLLSLATLALIVSGASATVSASNDDGWNPTPVVQVEQCGNETVYTKSGDYNDSRVYINFQDNDEAITVTAKTGYSLVSVKLDVENDGQTGLVTYPVADGVKFNPNPGDEIEKAKVVVKKVCKEVCNDKSALNYEAVVEGQTVANNKLCKYKEEVPVTPPATTTPTVTTTVAAPQVAATPAKAVAAGGGGGASSSATASVAALVASIGTMAFGALRFRKFNV